MKLYWCRFFVIRVPNRYYIVEICCYMCIFMLPIVHGLQTPSEHLAILGGFFFLLHSAVFWISQIKFCFFLSIFHFYTNCAAIEQRISCIFSLYDQLQLLCICGRWLFEPNGQSVPNGGKENACRTRSVWKSHEKTNCLGEHFDHGELTAKSRLCILVTVNSQWAHQEVTVSSWWAPDFFLMGNNENDFISDQRICDWQCWTEKCFVLFSYGNVCF